MPVLWTVVVINMSPWLGNKGDLSPRYRLKKENDLFCSNVLCCIVLFYANILNFEFQYSILLTIVRSMQQSWRHKERKKGRH